MTPQLHSNSAVDYICKIDNIQVPAIGVRVCHVADDLKSKRTYSLWYPSAASRGGEARACAHSGMRNS